MVSIKDALIHLFKAPLDAAVQAEEDYRNIWANWIEEKVKVLKKMGFKDSDFTQEQIDTILDNAPIVDLQGFIDVAISMRITEVRGKDLSLGGGINLGIARAEGRYSFYQSTTAESSFQASTRIGISNKTYTLANYFEEVNIRPANLEELTHAVEQLKRTSDLPSV